MNNSDANPDQVSYEAYLNKLLFFAFTCQGSSTKSLNEILVEKARSYGISTNVQEDVKCILNIKHAISILITKAAGSRTSLT